MEGKEIHLQVEELGLEVEQLDLEVRQLSLEVGELGVEVKETLFGRQGTWFGLFALLKPPNEKYPVPNRKQSYHCRPTLQIVPKSALGVDVKGLGL